jgi:hypothetical protein
LSYPESPEAASVRIPALAYGVGSSIPLSGPPQLLLAAAAPTTVAATVFILSRSPELFASTSTMLQSGQAALTMSMSRPVSPDQPGQSEELTELTVPSSPTRAKHALPAGFGTPEPSTGQAGSSGIPNAWRYALTSAMPWTDGSSIKATIFPPAVAEAGILYAASTSFGAMPPGDGDPPPPPPPPIDTQFGSPKPKPKPGPAAG